MNFEERANILLKELEETKKFELEKLMGSLDFEKYEKQLDIGQDPNSEEVKFITNLLSNGEYDDGDMSYVIEDAAANLEERKDIDRQLKELEADMKKNADKIQRSRAIIENFDHEEYKNELIKRYESNSIENLSKMSSEELDERLNDICKAYENIRFEREGQDGLPDIMENIKKYKRLIKGVSDVRPKGATLARDKEYPLEQPSKKSLKEVILERADLMNLPESARKLIKRLQEEESHPGKGLEALLNMAREKGYSKEDLPKFVRTILMPKFFKEWSEDSDKFEEKWFS